jgi:hypothetical protein
MTFGRPPGLPLVPAGKVSPHTGERYHADGKGEAEHHLRDGGAQPAGDGRGGRSAQLALVGGQQGESLVDDAALPTDLTDLLVPPGPDVAAVLHQRSATVADPHSLTS